MKKTIKKKRATRKRIYTAPRDKEHDALTKVALSHKESVQGLLQTELPPEVCERLILSTLERISDSYTNEDLKNAYADKAFTCKTKDDETVLIAFLVEHKSYVPTEPIYVQLLQYKISYWRDIALAGQNITCVIPIVIYHGEAEWEPKPFYGYFNLKSSVFNRYIPQFDIIYINLRSMPKEVIIAHETWGKLRAAFLALKFAFNRDYLLTNFELIINFVVDKNGQVNDVEVFFTMAIVEYIHRRTDMTEVEYSNLIYNVTQNSKDMAHSSVIDTILKKFKTEGRREGREEGREEAQLEKDKTFVTNLLLQTDFEDAKIASLANVSLDFIAQIRQTLEKGDNKSDV